MVECIFSRQSLLAALNLSPFTIVCEARITITVALTVPDWTCSTVNTWPAVHALHMH